VTNCTSDVDVDTPSTRSYAQASAFFSSFVTRSCEVLIGLLKEISGPLYSPLAKQQQPPAALAHNKGVKSQTKYPVLSNASYIHYGTTVEN